MVTLDDLIHLARENANMQEEIKRRVKRLEDSENK